MKRTLLILFAFALFACAHPVERAWDESAGETIAARIIDGIQFQEGDTGEWIRSYSFLTDDGCNTCLGTVVCAEEEDYYECRDSGLVLCTSVYCGGLNPVITVPKQ